MTNKQKAQIDAMAKTVANLTLEYQAICNDLVEAARRINDLEKQVKALQAPKRPWWKVWACG